MKTIRILVVLFLFLLVLTPIAWSTQYSNAILNSSLHTTEDLYERVKEYKSIIENMDAQIKGIMDEMDWLYLNMERIKDSEREVPYSFFVSIKEKKYNIRRLQKERDRYYKLVESFLGEINNRILKREKYSIRQSPAQEEVIQEQTIQDPKEIIKKKAPSELDQSENELQENAYFERLANETKRFENLLDRYSDLIEKKSMESKEITRQKQSEKAEKIQVVEIIETKPVQQKMVPVVSRNTQKIITFNSTDNNNIDKIQLNYEIQKAGLGDWIEITDSGECLRLKTTLPILFPIGSAEIANEYKSFFMRFANLLKTYEVQIMVQGYADIDPIHTKKYPSNFELGAIRAANVVHELVKNGLKPSIFKIHSPGKYRNSASGEPTQKALERRAEVTVVFVS